MDPNKIDLETLRISRHAWDKMGERGVTAQQVADGLRFPDIIEPDADRSRRRYVKGELVFVVGRDWSDPEIAVLVTVLWRKREQWTSDQMRNR